MRSLLAVQDALALAPRRALEVAAGGGGLAASLAASGCDVTANDLRAEPLAATLSEYVSGDRITVQGGNLFDLSPEQLGRFDLVIACEVIEHVAHPADLLRQLKRFLAPGGRILLTTPNGSYFRNRLPSLAEAGDAVELEARQFKPDADGHLFLLTPAELCELAASANLTVERLNLWGIPFVTGHLGCRVASGRMSTAPAYYAERAAQWLPASWRARLCVEISAILK
jgi:2-polyprenyl-6-hydroxyphenyl methylase/3-demethylubiquinone-9 3-methyltransferase